MIKEVNRALILTNKSVQTLFLRFCSSHVQHTAIHAKAHLHCHCTALQLQKERNLTQQLKIKN